MVVFVFVFLFVFAFVFVFVAEVCCGNREERWEGLSVMEGTIVSANSTMVAVC